MTNIDFAALAANVQDAPEESLSRKSGAGRPKQDNPFLTVVLDSWDKGDEDATMGITKTLTVDNNRERGKTGEPKNVTTIKGLIRRAAEEQGLGVRIVTVETKAGKNLPDGEHGTKTIIKFAAKVKTERTRKDGDDAPAE